jgi:hypothetical protein
VLVLVRMACDRSSTVFSFHSRPMISFSPSSLAFGTVGMLRCTVLEDFHLQ